VKKLLTTNSRLRHCELGASGLGAAILVSFFAIALLGSMTIISLKANHKSLTSTQFLGELEHLLAPLQSIFAALSFTDPELKVATHSVELNANASDASVAQGGQAPNAAEVTRQVKKAPKGPITILASDMLAAARGSGLRLKPAAGASSSEQPQDSAQAADAGSSETQTPEIVVPSQRLKANPQNNEEQSSKDGSFFDTIENWSEKQSSILLNIVDQKRLAPTVFIIGLLGLLAILFKITFGTALFFYRRWSQLKEWKLHKDETAAAKQGGAEPINRPSPITGKHDSRDRDGSAGANRPVFESDASPSVTQGSKIEEQQPSQKPTEDREKQLLKEINDLNKELAWARDEAERAQAETARLSENELDLTSATDASAQEELAKARAEAERVRNDLVAAQEEMASARAENENLSKAQQEVEQQANQLQGQLDQLREELAQAKTEAEESQAHNPRTQAEAGETIEDARRSLAAAKEEANRALEGWIAARNETEKLRAENKQFREAQQAAKQNIGQTHIDLKNLREEFARVEVELHHSRHEVARLSEELSRSEQTAAEFRTDCQKIQDRLWHSERNNEQIHRTLVQARKNSLLSLREQLADRRSALEAWERLLLGESERMSREEETIKAKLQAIENKPQPQMQAPDTTAPSSESLKQISQKLGGPVPRNDDDDDIASSSVPLPDQLVEQASHEFTEFGQRMLSIKETSRNATTSTTLTPIKTACEQNQTVFDRQFAEARSDGTQQMPYQASPSSQDTGDV